MTAIPSGIFRLSNELLRDILDHIEADPDKLVNLDRRAYLSQESFRLPELPSPDQAQDVANLRLTCRRFSELGAIHQFARVTTRFSRRGLRRLEWIAGQAHLAKHVKKFSYMVPYFYVEGRERARDRLQRLRGSLGTIDVRHFIKKVNEQEDIVQSEEDVRTLRKAHAAFSALQHVQILRVQDAEDSVLLGYLRQNQNRAPLVDLRWPPACSHSTKTVCKALLDSRSPCSRFSSPMLSPQSAEALAAHPPKSLRTLVQRITSLELHFDDGTDLDNRMTDLSGLFRTIFTAAENMQAVHVGFPSYRPLTLPLETVFHHIRWERLHAFGIQAWKLDAEEVIGLVRRHRDRLKGLRLRDVLLKEGSSWKDILQVLHDEMPRLDWVSLRRIGYAKHFEEQSATSGIEIDDLPGGGSESDDESDDFAEARSQNEGDDGISEAGSTEASDAQADDTGDEDDNGPHAHELGFPQLSLDPKPGCTCGGRGNVEELGDNGVYVSNTQRKMWEKWCTLRCNLHSKK